MEARFSSEPSFTDLSAQTPEFEVPLPATPGISSQLSSLGATAGVVSEGVDDGGVVSTGFVSEGDGVGVGVSTGFVSEGDGVGV
ncbi:hypothetical protein SAMN05660916_00658, partial [Arthrobacter sp. 31Cvi3.1E]